MAKPENTHPEALAAIRADSLIQAIRKAMVLTWVCWKNLKNKRFFFLDLFSVTGSVGFVAVPAFLVGLILLILPQGRDTLLIIVEQMMSDNYWSLVGLFIAITLWSLFSELAVRYAISISDNSKLNLSDLRVRWRKTIQSMLAGIFLLWPGFLVLIGFMITFFTAEYIRWPERLLYIGIPIIALVLFLWLISFLYFHKFEPKGKSRSKTTILGHRALPDNEQKWLNKLYGIYNDYVFSLPKPTNFKGSFKDELKDFTDLYLSDHAVTDSNVFPQSDALNEDRRVPALFELQNMDSIRKSTGIYKWVYKIPSLKFYPEFHKQIRRIALIGLALLVFLSFVPAEWPVYDHIGAPGLVCLAFACYTGIYSGLLYLENVVFPRFPISIRLFLLIWVLVISFINHDHPVRLYGKSEQRPAVQTHFEDWFETYKQKMDKRTGDTLDKYPVVFICAEGGAFRTGAYTALFLTQLEAELSKRKVPIDFRHSIYAMSGVSGGAVGLGFYNAAAFRSNIPFRDTMSVEKTRQFFLHDSLSPLIGKMFFSEFLNLFYWDQADLFDRSAALEKSWESAYNQFVGAGKRNTYGDEFILPDTGLAKPMLLINTAEVETGLQCWMSNVRADSLMFDTRRDLLTKKVPNTRYSTGINFSSRFPLFSPGAKIDVGKHRLHYLDGGYVENTGSATMLEVLNELRKTKTYRKVLPVVISLRFSEEKKDTGDIKFLNEVNEIISGLYNTRSGRNETATYLLERSLKPESGVYITAPLTPEEQKVPMNWVLSEQSIDRIQFDIKEKLLPDGKILQQFFRKDLTYLPLKPVK